MQLLDPMRFHAAARTPLSDAVQLPVDIALALRQADSQSSAGGSSSSSSSSAVAAIMSGASQFVSVADMVHAPPIGAHHAANRLDPALAVGDTPLSDRLLAVGDIPRPPLPSSSSPSSSMPWNAPLSYADAGAIVSAGGPVARAHALKSAHRDLSALDAELDALTAMAADLTRELDAPRATVRALEEQERAAAIDRLMFHADAAQADAQNAQGKQELIALLVRETERQLGFATPHAAGTATQHQNQQPSQRQLQTPNHGRSIGSTASTPAPSLLYPSDRFGSRLPAVAEASFEMSGSFGDADFGSTSSSSSSSSSSSAQQAESDAPTKQAAKRAAPPPSSAARASTAASTPAHRSLAAAAPTPTMATPAPVSATLSKNLRAASRLADQLLADAANGVGFVQLGKATPADAGAARGRYANLGDTQ